MVNNGVFVSSLQLVINDITHRFIRRVLRSVFKSSDIGSAAQILRKQLVLDNETIASLNDSITAMLKVKDSNERSNLSDEDAAALKKVLLELGIIATIPVVEYKMPLYYETYNSTIIVQPRLRYGQVNAVINYIQDNLQGLSASEKELLIETIRRDALGKLLEEQIQLNVLNGLSKFYAVKKLVSVIQGNMGEFDLALKTNKSIKHHIFEIKLSSKVIENQYKYLKNDKLIQDTIGGIDAVDDRTVIYLGDSCVLKNGIRYVNAEEFLMTLDKYIPKPKDDSNLNKLNLM